MTAVARFAPPGAPGPAGAGAGPRKVRDRARLRTHHHRLRHPIRQLRIVQDHVLVGHRRIVVPEGQRIRLEAPDVDRRGPARVHVHDPRRKGQNNRLGERLRLERHRILPVRQRQRPVAVDPARNPVDPVRRPRLVVQQPLPGRERPRSVARQMEGQRRRRLLEPPSPEVEVVPRLVRGVAPHPVERIDRHRRRHRRRHQRDQKREHRPGHRRGGGDLDRRRPDPVDVRIRADEERGAVRKRRLRPVRRLRHHPERHRRLSRNDPRPRIPRTHDQLLGQIQKDRLRLLPEQGRRRRRERQTPVVVAVHRLTVQIHRQRRRPLRHRTETGQIPHPVPRPVLEQAPEVDLPLAEQDRRRHLHRRPRRHRRQRPAPRRLPVETLVLPPREQRHRRGRHRPHRIAELVLDRPQSPRRPQTRRQMLPEVPRLLVRMKEDHLQPLAVLEPRRPLQTRVAKREHHQLLQLRIPEVILHEERRRLHRRPPVVERVGRVRHLRRPRLVVDQNPQHPVPPDRPRLLRVRLRNLRSPDRIRGRIAVGVHPRRRRRERRQRLPVRVIPPDPVAPDLPVVRRRAPVPPPPRARRPDQDHPRRQRRVRRHLHPRPRRHLQVQALSLPRRAVGRKLPPPPAVPPPALLRHRIHHRVVPHHRRQRRRQNLHHQPRRTAPPSMLPGGKIKPAPGSAWLVGSRSPWATCE